MSLTSKARWSGVCPGRRIAYSTRSALPGTVAGSVFVETIFGWPGMGRLMVTSIVARDYPGVLGCAAAYAAIVIVANLAAELLLPWADPRVAT